MVYLAKLATAVGIFILLALCLVILLQVGSTVPGHTVFWIQEWNCFSELLLLILQLLPSQLKPKQSCKGGSEDCLQFTAPKGWESAHRMFYALILFAGLDHLCTPVVYNMICISYTVARKKYKPQQYKRHFPSSYSPEGWWVSHWLLCCSATLPIQFIHNLLSISLMCTWIDGWA